MAVLKTIPWGGGPRLFKRGHRPCLRPSMIPSRDGVGLPVPNEAEVLKLLKRLKKKGGDSNENH